MLNSGYGKVAAGLCDLPGLVIDDPIADSGFGTTEILAGKLISFSRAVVVDRVGTVDENAESHLADVPVARLGPQGLTTKLVQSASLIPLRPPPKSSTHPSSGRAGPVGGASSCAFRKAWWSGPHSFQASPQGVGTERGKGLGLSNSVLSETAGARVPEVPGSRLNREACIDG